MGEEWPLILRALNASELAVGVQGVPLKAELLRDVWGDGGFQVEVGGVCTRENGPTGSVLRCFIGCFITSYASVAWTPAESDALSLGGDSNKPLLNFKNKGVRWHNIRNR